MNNKLIFPALTGIFVTLSWVANSAQAATIVTSKRIFQNISSNMTARKVDITLPNVEGNNGYSWLKIIPVAPGRRTFNVPIPMDIMRGGTITNIMPDNFFVFEEKMLEVVTSSKKKNSPLPASQVIFKKLDGTEIGIDDQPTPEVSLKKRGSHNSTTDGFGGSSKFAMILQNSSTEIIEITGFQLFQNIEMNPFIAALESTLPNNLYTDPINAIGTGELVNNIMSDFTLNPGEELAFHFDFDFDRNLIGISSGFCNDDDYECSDSSMVLSTPEPASTLSLLALCTLGAALTLKRKQKLSKSTEKETTKVS